MYPESQWPTFRAAFKPLWATLGYSGHLAFQVGTTAGSTPPFQAKHQLVSACSQRLCSYLSREGAVLNQELSPLPGDLVENDLISWAYYSLSQTESASSPFSSQWATWGIVAYDIGLLGFPGGSCARHSDRSLRTLAGLTEVFRYPVGITSLPKGSLPRLIGARRVVAI